MICDTCSKNFEIKMSPFGPSNCYECMEKLRDKQNTIPFFWETIHGDLFRSKVFGGWLIKQTSKVGEYKTYQLCFIPDKWHEWKLGEEQNEIPDSYGKIEL